jgi:AcrR family transcriptional regulator
MDQDHATTMDPTASLSPIARRLVEAARRLLARGGFDALTVEAVAAEAGAYRDSVRYYFGSKAAFVAAVVDSLAHDQMLNATDETSRLPPDEQRVHSLVSADRKLLDDRDSFRDLFAILPHALRDDELRSRVAALYGWYRDVYADLISGHTGADRERLRRLASLMVAMIDGLAVQALLDPQAVDPEALLALWEDMLRHALSAEPA